MSEEEQRRRGELEGALREASSIFKRELQEKNEQLQLLRREIRCATWPGWDEFARVCCVDRRSSRAQSAAAI